MNVHSYCVGVSLPAASAALIFPVNGLPSSIYPPDLKASSEYGNSDPVAPPTTKPPSLVKATVSRT